MGDYIDRQAAIQEIVKLRNEIYQGKRPNIEMAQVASIINCLPAADVEPVVHAKWENNKNEYPECTNCGYMPAYDPAIDDINYSPYCPNCGAKMDVEEIEKQREDLEKKEKIIAEAKGIARDLGFYLQRNDYQTALKLVESFGGEQK